MQNKLRALLLVAVAVSMVPLSGCARNGRARADTRYVARDVNTLYNAAWQQMRNHNYTAAALIFDEVERQHPYSIWARRALSIDLV